MKNSKNVMICMAVFLCLLLLIAPKVNAATEDIFTYKLADGTATITGCTAPTGAITIPETLGGCPVTAIGDNAFYRCTNLTAVTIPNTVTSIGSDAFAYCSGLTAITIPDSVTEIGECAFIYCSGITQITIGKGLKKVDMRGLDPLTMPLQDVYITDPNAWCKVEFASTANPLSLAACGHILDADGNEVTELVLDPTLQTIPDEAFRNCNNLKSVTIPNTVTSIGSNAFSRCTGLTAITIPDSVTTIGDSAFRRCTSLISLDLGNGITTIGESAFYECDGIASLVIPDSVTEIGDFAFCYCSGITQITMGKGLKKSGSSAFGHCSGLENVYITDLDSWCKAEFDGWQASPLVPADFGHILDADGNEITELVLDPTLQTIPDEAFANCKNLKSVIIPNTVTTIGMRAFQNCTGLTSVTLPDSLTTIGHYAFDKCAGLTSVTLPDSLTTIGHYAFEKCAGLTTLVIPSGVTTVEQWAFSGCVGLTSVVIPSSLTVLGDYAFSHCSGLTRVSVPEGMTTLSEGAFYKCTNLTTLDLPLSLKAIKEYASYAMPSLKTIYYAGSAAQWKEISVSSHNNLSYATIHYDHTHDYTVITQTATCTQQGFVRYTCVHGETIETNTVPALGHDYSGVEALIEPTCTQAGYRGVACIRCDSVREETAVPALGHLPVEIGLREPSCSEKGVSKAGSKCDRCGVYIKRPVWIPMVDHTWNEGVYCPPTDSIDGYLLYTCVNCGATKSENKVTAQPEAQITESGNAVQFSVTVQGDVQSYRWQYRRIYKWFDTTMSGYNTHTLTVNAIGSRNGYNYRCEITFKDGTVLYSDPAELTVITHITGIQSPNDQTVALGAKGQFTAAAEGEGIKYQWQYQRPGSTVWIDTAMEGAKKPTVMIETAAARDGYRYRCKITDVTGNVAYTEAATMRVLSFTEHPEEVFTPLGGIVTFHVSASVDSGFTYQWQYSKYGSSWTNTTMPGYNTDTLTVEATEDLNELFFRCVLTGSKNSQTVSKMAQFHTGEPLLIFEEPMDVTCKAGQEVCFEVVSGFTFCYQWQYQRPGSDKWYTTTATGNKTSMLYVTAKAGNNGYRYRCVVTGRDGTVYIAKAATLTVE